jgi:hypothetical protein
MNKGRGVSPSYISKRREYNKQSIISSTTLKQDIYFLGFQWSIQSTSYNGEEDDGLHQHMYNKQRIISTTTLKQDKVFLTYQHGRIAIDTCQQLSNRLWIISYSWAQVNLPQVMVSLRYIIDNIILLQWKCVNTKQKQM